MIDVPQNLRALVNEYATKDQEKINKSKNIILLLLLFRQVE